MIPLFRKSAGQGYTPREGDRLIFPEVKGGEGKTYASLEAKGGEKIQWGYRGPEVIEIIDDVMGVAALTASAALFAAGYGL
jgi:hypothetical protein